MKLHTRHKDKVIAVNKQTDEMFIFINEKEALEKTIEMNKSDTDHPSFNFYIIQETEKLAYIGCLCREFGTDNYFIDPNQKELI